MSTPPRVYPDHHLLEGVPKIGYRIRLNPHMGSLESALKYLGLPADYDTLMALSGGAWRRFWERDDGGNVDLGYLGPMIYHRALRSVGYTCEVLREEDREPVRHALVGSIATGKPVVAPFGGPEGGVICGYEQNGQVLLGWSYFQDSGDSYYRNLAWHAEESGAGMVVILGGKGESHPVEHLLQSTLTYALDLERTKSRDETPNHIAGLAAYDAWADALEVDADYPWDGWKVMRLRGMIHGDQVAMTADRRSAKVWLRQMAEAVPEVAEDLTAAAELYKQISLCQELYPWKAKPDSDTVAKALLEPQTRRALATEVRAKKALEERAVGHLAEALSWLG